MGREGRVSLPTKKVMRGRFILETAVGVRSQESGVRSQESGVRSQESGVRSQESGVRSQKSEGKQVTGRAPFTRGAEALRTPRGAEKAGIRLADYRSTPFRVGELMFDDDSFTPVKGKTNELFSALFHRRYARPELAYSESTAYPADRLSAKNMAAKLAVSTLSDVRNTMFMSGVTAFPRTHWDTLGPAMKRHIRIHERVAGHTPRGPFKHFWGEHGRKVSGDNTYSLFLAAGVPFEVCDEPPGDGWTFLGEADARGLADTLKPGQTQWVVPSEISTTDSESRAGFSKTGPAQVVAESLPALFAPKKEILPQLKNTPFIEEGKPAVCAWYPTARIALIWNLSEQKETLTLRTANETRPIEIDGLDIALIDDVRVL